MSGDGIGSYGASGGADVPPVMMWVQPSPEQAAPVSSGEQAQAMVPAAQPMPTPDDFAAIAPAPQEQRPALNDDLPPALRSAVAASPLRHRGVGGLGMDEAQAASDRTLLGAALVLVGVGAAIGANKGTMFTAIAGGLYGGAAVNAWRSARVAKTDRKEAIVSGTFAIIGGGIATWLLWRHRESTATKQKEK